MFRQLLGGAILRESNANDSRLSHWEKKCRQPCRVCKPTELAVEQRLKDSFWFRCISINEMNKRNEFEKKLIATISFCRVCEASEKWLGRFAYPDEMACSELWNRDCVFDKKQVLRDDGLEDLKQLVDGTRSIFDQLGKKETDQVSAVSSRKLLNKPVLFLREGERLRDMALNLLDAPK